MSRGQTSVPVTCGRHSNQFEFTQQVSGKQFCRRDKVFNLVHTRRFLLGACHCDMSPGLNASCVQTFKRKDSWGLMSRRHVTVTCHGDMSRGKNFVPETCCMNPNWFEFSQQVAGTVVCPCDMSLRLNSSCDKVLGQPITDHHFIPNNTATYFLFVPCVIANQN